MPKQEIKNGKLWSPTEMKILARFPHLTNEQMGLVLKRSAKAVLRKRQKT